ncbi:hypothetical protein F4804DRAFT_351473 [Jackrogersella minutella]|nr:hypothetical protein F4804DRAFT_351473 [Jackrogersella minutella]
MALMIDGIALVTGAGSGIGRECCLAYAAEGARGVVLADLNQDAALQVARDSEAVATHPDYKAIAVSVDVSDVDSVDAMVKVAVDTFGGIDYLLNSAGVGVQKPLPTEDVDLNEMNKFWKVNVLGTLNCMKAVTKAMKNQSVKTCTNRGRVREVGRGVIINLGSCNSYVATPNIMQYTTSKHAVLGMTRNAALDNAVHGIRVNAICPGWVETPMVDAAIAGDPNLPQMMKTIIPMRRIAKPEEIADVVLFMSSPRSSYDSGPFTKFPGEGLRHPRRFITGHNKDGKGVFVVDDDGDHHRVMVRGKGASNIIYSTSSNPVDMNDDADLKYAKENEPGIHVTDGSVARLIDFAPGVVSPFHRAMSIDYGVVIEGTFELTLDSGEKKVMLPGDMSVNRGCMHTWRNIDPYRSGRMLFVLLDVKPLTVNGKVLGEELGDLAGEYAHTK